MPPNETDKQPGIEDMLRGLIYSHNRANDNTAGEELIGVRAQ